MDLRPARAALPEPLALLRERVVSAIDGVPFYADLYAPHGAPPADLGEFSAWYAASRDQPHRLRGRRRRGSRPPRLCRGAAGPQADERQHGHSIRPLRRRARRLLPDWRFRRPHFAAGEESPTSLEFLFPERFRRDRQVRVVGGEAAARDAGRPPVNRAEKSYSTLTDALKAPEQMYVDLAAKKPATLIGYASSIVRLAEWMAAEGHTLPSVRRIWTTSEMLTPEGREAIAEAFGFVPREAYASVEFGFMGWQETPGGPYNLETDRLVFEGVSLASPSTPPAPAPCHASSFPTCSTTRRRCSATTSATSP